jgi:transposase
MARVRTGSGKIVKDGAKRAAVELWRAKVPLSTISSQLKLSESTLRRILAFAKRNPINPIIPRKPGSGRPKKIIEETRRLIKKKLQANPSLTAVKLKRVIPALANVSIRSIQDCCLKDLKLPSRRKAKEPLLNERIKEQRLTFAREHVAWSVDDWKMVMFSDESHFELRCGSQDRRCRRENGSDRFAPEFTFKTVKHPPKIMVWGCFSWRGRGGIEFLKTGEMMNGLRYRQLLEEKLEFFMDRHGCTHFLQDGAPCHRSKIVTAWFRQRPNIQLVDWPGELSRPQPYRDSLGVDEEEVAGPQLHQLAAVERGHPEGVG